MFYQIFLSPQVERWAIITYKNGIHVLLHELPNKLRLRTLGNKETSANCLNLIEWYPSAQYPRQNEIFANTSRKPLKNRNQIPLAVCYFTWKLELASNILLAIVDWHSRKNSSDSLYLYWELFRRFHILLSNKKTGKANI